MGDVQDDDVLCGIGSVPICKSCGSERVARDAWACWNPQTGLWEIENVFDQEYCHKCEGETHFVWKRVEAVPSQKTRELNDRFRMQGKGKGSILLTVGVQAEGRDFIKAAYLAIRNFAAFSKDNDPWGEHDFGRVEVASKAVHWKIDYYNPTLTAGSENPANEGETHRVLTIMLPSEY